MRRSHRRRATVLALAGACAAGFARERETDIAMTQSVQFRSWGFR
jgi:hypothetical protein